jgi:hypothetical protein
VIIQVPQAFATAAGLPLATSGSICQMVNSVSGAPYPLPIAPGGSTSVSLAGNGLLRVGDQIPCGPGVLLVLGPPAAAFIADLGSP